MLLSKIISHISLEGQDLSSDFVTEICFYTFSDGGKGGVLL